MFYSPWGSVRIRTEYAPGFLRVSTSHLEGLVLSQDFAETHLSEAAREEAERWGHFYCYEAEIAWMIPAFELPQFWPQLFANTPDLLANAHDYLWQNLSRHNSKYLLKRGITPEASGFAAWKADVEAIAPHALADVAHLIEPALKGEAIAR
ncbi:MAG TPA: hypothetical protein V6C78_22125 [Crinalium sp.]|jgi:hypothetical protein